MQAVRRIALVSSLVTACSLVLAQDLEQETVGKAAETTTRSVVTPRQGQWPAEPTDPWLRVWWREIEAEAEGVSVSASGAEVSWSQAGAHTPGSEAWAAGGAVILASASLLVRRVFRVP